MFFLLACVPPPSLPAAARVDLVLVPGCPAEEDGQLSGCLWQRAIWAHALWAAGAVGHFVTSGAAVHNRYVEADALAAGMIALGVPDSAIIRDLRALHTDQNVALALEVQRANPTWSFGVASHGYQTDACCKMATTWTDLSCTALHMDMSLVRTRMEAGLPPVQLTPVPVEAWLPLPERERRIAALTGVRRPSSFWVYVGQATLATFGKAQAPPLPPPIEVLLPLTD